MKLTERERYIAIGVGGALVLLLLNWLVLDPYVEARRQVERDLAEARSQQADANNLFREQHARARQWKEIQSLGLKSDASQAESQALNAIIELAQFSNVTLPAQKQERTTTEGKFGVIGYSVTASGSMRQISQFLYSLETASIPIRVTEIQLTPHREGTDELSARISVSTLCELPDAPKAGEHS